MSGTLAATGAIGAGVPRLVWAARPGPTNRPPAPAPPAGLVVPVTVADLLAAAGVGGGVR